MTAVSVRVWSHTHQLPKIHCYYINLLSSVTRYLNSSRLNDFKMDLSQTAQQRSGAQDFQSQKIKNRKETQRKKKTSNKQRNKDIPVGISWKGKATETYKRK